jgi:CBS domain-containing protein
MENIRVSDIMTRSPISVAPSTNLLECAKKMVRKKVGSLLIIEDSKLVGFISTSDILWALIKKTKQDLSSIKAIEISPKKIATTKPVATLKEALEKMKKFKFNSLPVIYEGKLAGLITLNDILTFHPEVYPELGELSQIREEEEKLKRFQKASKIREGICEECGHFDMLYLADGRLMCGSCREAM